MERDNKALVWHWFEEVWNRGRADLIDQLRSPDAVATGLGEGSLESRGPEAFKTFHSNLRSALPDLHVCIEDMIAEGDRVAVRLVLQGTHLGPGLGVPPNGAKVCAGAILIVRVVDGLIVQAWNSVDQLTLLRQAGALPGSGGPDRFLTPR